jgi:hypothetical protein
MRFGVGKVKRAIFSERKSAFPVSPSTPFQNIKRQVEDLPAARVRGYLLTAFSLRKKAIRWQTMFRTSYLLRTLLQLET